MTWPVVARERGGVTGRVRVRILESGVALLDRVFGNTETDAALDALASALVTGSITSKPGYLTIGIGPVNMLTAVQADTSSVTGWSALTNCTVALSSAEIWTGPSSLAMTASAAGTMTATTSTGSSGAAVVGGFQYCAAAHFYAAATARTVSVNIAWYDSTGTLISTSAGTGVSDSTTGWTRAGVVAAAPATAAYASVQVSVASAASGEAHYVGGVLLGYSPDGGHYPWSAGGQTGAPAQTDTSLFLERYQGRARFDSSSTQEQTAVFLHGYTTTSPAGAVTEAGLYDTDVSETSLNAQASVGDTSLTVAADGPAVAGGTQVVIAAAPLASPAISSFTGASTTGGYLVGGDVYYYEITAVNALGETVPGTETSYTVPSGSNTNQITLNWPTSLGASSYKVYRGTSSGGELYLATVTASAAQTTLTENLTSSQTTLTVASATGFPGSGNYNILVDSEEMTVTAGQGTTTWTVTRAANGSTAATHSNGATVTLETSYTDSSNTTPSGAPPASDTSGGQTEYATLAAPGVAAGATSWPLTDALLSGHPDSAPVAAMTGTLWGHVALTNVVKESTQTLSLQWEVTFANA